MLSVLRAGLFLVGMLALIGAVMVARRRQWFLSLYFAMTLLTILTTPWQNQFWRYLASLAPLTLIFLFVALFGVRRWVSREHAESARVVGMTVIALR